MPPTILADDLRESLSSGMPESKIQVGRLLRACFLLPIWYPVAVSSEKDEHCVLSWQKGQMDKGA